MKEAGLDEVEGGHLIEIIRFDKEIISPVNEDEYILGGDRLIFAGKVDEILKLRDSHQLVNAIHHVFSLDEIDSNRKLRMVHVRFTSSLVGTRMADSDFEERNNVVLVAVAREGERINGSPREIVLEKGDTLLLECPPHFNAEDNTFSSNLQFFDTDLLVKDLGVFTHPVSDDSAFLAERHTVAASQFPGRLCHDYLPLLLHRPGAQEHRLGPADGICRFYQSGKRHRVHGYRQPAGRRHPFGMRNQSDVCFGLHLPAGYLHYGIHQQYRHGGYILPHHL